MIVYLLMSIDEKLIARRSSIHNEGKNEKTEEDTKEDLTDFRHPSAQWSKSNNGRKDRHDDKGERIM